MGCREGTRAPARRERAAGTAVALVALLLGCGGWLVARPGPARAADPAEAIIGRYYQCQEREDLDGFMALQLFSDDHERYRRRLITGDRWQRVGMRDVELGPVESVVAPDGRRMVARFTVSYVLRVKETRDEIARREENLAVLERSNGWKIRRIVPQEELHRTPQALDDARLAELAAERKLFALLPDPQKDAATPAPAAPAATAAPTPGTEGRSAKPALPEVPAAAPAKEQGGGKPEPGPAPAEEAAHGRRVILAVFADGAGGARTPSPFPSSTNRLNVEVAFPAPGGVGFVTLVVSDLGAGKRMFEIPILVGEAEKRVLLLRRPLTGWPSGRYEVVARDGDGNTLSKVRFRIED